MFYDTSLHSKFRIYKTHNKKVIYCKLYFITKILIKLHFYHNKSFLNLVISDILENKLNPTK